MKIMKTVSLLMLVLPSIVFTQNALNGVALKVNNMPITLYEISQLQKERKLSRQEAKHILILKAIKKQEISRLKIVAGEIDIDKQISAAAKVKGISRDQFIANMENDGYSYEALRDFYREHVLEELLIQRILSTGLKIVDEKELKKYYDEHHEEFTLPREVTLVQYAAQNERILAQTINNPLIRLPGVSRREEKVELSGINPQIAQLFAQTPKGQFTSAIENSGVWLAFYIKDKVGSIVIPFEQVKPLVMQQVVLSRRDRILQEYFERLIANASITEIRE